MIAQIRALLDALSGEQLDRFVDEVYKDYLQAIQIADTGLTGVREEHARSGNSNLVTSIAARWMLVS